MLSIRFDRLLAGRIQMSTNSARAISDLNRGAGSLGDRRRTSLRLSRGIARHGL
jgi:hypothetical protein